MSVFIWLGRQKSASADATQRVKDPQLKRLPKEKNKQAFRIDDFLGHRMTTSIGTMEARRDEPLQ